MQLVLISNDYETHRDLMSFAKAVTLCHKSASSIVMKVNKIVIRMVRIMRMISAALNQIYQLSPQKKQMMYLIPKLSLISLL